MFGFEVVDMAMMSGWVLYATIFIFPFIQEDVAVIGAATASITGAGETAIILPVILLGLIGSDAWKYWLGRMARSRSWAHKFAKKKGVSVAGELVQKEFITTMMTARFVPGTRIPTYIACGFFRVEYLKYIIVLATTATIYVAITFGLFHTVGAVAGEQAKYWLPAIAITFIATYIGFRWFTHLNNKRGPMTPLTEEQDHPMSEMPGFEGNPLETKGEDENEDMKE